MNKIKKDIDLFFLCSLIEFIGRKQKLTRKDTAASLGYDKLRHIYEYADILHCEPIAEVAGEFIKICRIETGTFDNVADCKYDVPSYWDIGDVYTRLIQDIMNSRGDDRVIDTLQEIYGSWISDSISNYNSDFFYQPRDYIRECYLEGKVL